jgi:uncharacterized membrane protein YeaQ/YmgE (transglycosylase-associated protein family)
MLNILVWIIVGGIAGWLASLVVRGTGLGIIGAVLGSLLLTLLLPGTFAFTGFSWGSLVIAFIGAVILLFIVRLVRGRTASART